MTREQPTMALILPPHKCGITLQHNEHKVFYQSADDYVKQNEHHYDWKDDESRQKAIDTDSIWTIQWYPETPVGFRAMAAPTFDELMEMIKECI